MSWDKWENPGTGGYRETRSFLGIHRASDISDTAIDKELEQGRNPRSKFARQMRQMAPAERRKVSSRIKARETKRGQGKKK